MNRFWLSLSALLLLFGFALYNGYCLDRYTDDLIRLLTEAEVCAADGDWDAAYDKTEAALDRWFSRETYLHMVLQHSDTDAILLSFQEVRQLLAHPNTGDEYAAANARLITQLRLLSEMEQLNWKNVM